MAKVNYTEQFMDDVASARVVGKRNEIRKSVERLSDFPGIGSGNLSEYIVKTYGANVRKFVVSPFLVICDYDQDTDVVNVLGLVHQRRAF